MNVQLGDFNSDGLADIAGRHPNGGWYVARSTGATFVTEQWTSWANVAWSDVRTGNFSNSHITATFNPNIATGDPQSQASSFNADSTANISAVRLANMGQENGAPLKFGVQKNEVININSGARQFRPSVETEFSRSINGARETIFAAFEECSADHR